MNEGMSGPGEKSQRRVRSCLYARDSIDLFSVLWLLNEIAQDFFAL